MGAGRFGQQVAHFEGPSNHGLWPKFHWPPTPLGGDMKFQVLWPPTKLQIDFQSCWPYSSFHKKIILPSFVCLWRGIQKYWKFFSKILKFSIFPEKTVDFWPHFDSLLQILLRLEFWPFGLYGLSKGRAFMVHCQIFVHSARWPDICCQSRPIFGFSFFK